jgi:hypothetical protein
MTASSTRRNGGDARVRSPGTRNNGEHPAIGQSWRRCCNAFARGNGAPVAVRRQFVAIHSGSSAQRTGANLGPQTATSEDDAELGGEQAEHRSDASIAPSCTAPGPRGFAGSSDHEGASRGCGRESAPTPPVRESGFAAFDERRPGWAFEFAAGSCTLRRRASNDAQETKHGG